VLTKERSVARDLTLKGTPEGTQVVLTSIDRIHPETQEAIWEAFMKFSDSRNEADKDPDGLDPYTDETSLDDLAGFLELDPVDWEDALYFLRHRTRLHVENGGNPDPRTNHTIAEFIDVAFKNWAPKAA